MVFDFHVPDDQSYPLHITDRNNIDIHTLLQVVNHPDVVASTTGGEIKNQIFSVPINYKELIKNVIEKGKFHIHWINFFKDFPQNENALNEFKISFKDVEVTKYSDYCNIKGNMKSLTLFRNVKLQ